jgi:hypothetical protein
MTEVNETEENTAAKVKKKPARLRTELQRRVWMKRLLTEIENRLEKDPGKPSLADYIRLLQLQKEMEAAKPPKEIIIQWVADRKTPDTTA